MRKKINFKTVGVSLLTLILCISLFNCSGKSEEDLIGESMDKIGDYAEDRDENGILSYISLDYADDEGRSYDEIEALLKEYFSRYRGIVVNLLATRILSVTAPTAQVETEVALSSGAAKVFRKAVRYSGQFYRFKLQLVKEGEKWKVIKASWENILLTELFPESTEIIKKLFPNL